MAQTQRQINIQALNAFILLILCFSATARAEITTYGPITIDLPGTWSCQTEDPNMICLDEGGADQKSSAVVISYKRKSAEDNLLVYKDQLSRPRQLQVGEVATPSVIKGVKNTIISGTTWIEGIHENSEVQDYITHYYATVVGDWAILTSMSIHKESYDVEMPILRTAIENIKLTPHFHLLSGAAGSAMQAPGVQENSGAQPMTYSATKAQQPKGRYVEVFGLKVKKLHLYMFVGLFIVLGLLFYAITMD